MERRGSWDARRPVERVLERLQGLGKRVEWRGSSWSAQCPAHDDDRASLSIREGERGEVLLHCFAGCDTREVTRCLGLVMRDLFAETVDSGQWAVGSEARSGGGGCCRVAGGETGGCGQGAVKPGSETAAPLTPDHRPLSTTYDYRDAAGVLRYQVVRAAGKQFRVRRPVAGGWESGLGDVPRLPYNLPALQAAPADALVFVVEGEKDVETLRAHDLLATTNFGGAGKWGEELTPHLIGKRVAVLPDNDEPGQKHARQVLASLRRAGITAAVLALPGLPPKGDVTDWLQAGGTAEELQTQAAAALAKEAEVFSVSPLSSLSSLSSPPPDGPAWPAPLAPAAFHGLAGEVVRAIEPHTEADPAALLLTFVTAVGNLIGAGPHAEVEACRHGLNLFVTLVGQSAKARKGTSEHHIRQLLTVIEPEWSRDCIQTGLSSGEGLVWHVRDAEPPGSTDRSPDGRPVSRPPDPGVTDKRLLVIESEFANLLKVMGREGNTLSPLLRCAWDGKKLQSLTKNSPLKATGAHISLIAHTTVEELRRGLTQTESVNGFANRFLWVCVRRSKVLPFGGGTPEIEALQDRLARARVQALKLERVTWSEAARREWEVVYEALSEGSEGLAGAATSRAEAQALRLATLYAVLDGSALIQPAHLRAALAVWDYCEASARCLFGTTSDDPLAERVAALVEAAPAGLTRSELWEELGHHVRAGQLRHALTTLARAGRLTREARRNTGGRPAEVWRAVTAPPSVPPSHLARLEQAARARGCEESEESEETEEGR